MNTIKKISGLLAVTLLLSAGTAFGQSDNGSIQANASVLTQIQVTAGNSLEFGNVSPGVAKTIALTGAFDMQVLGGTATGGERLGTFTIGKGANSFFTLSWTLPTELTTTGTGNINMPISFADIDSRKLGLLSGGASTVPFSVGVLNTNTGITNTAARDEIAAAINLTVTLGGTVNPAVDQVSGSYTGDITLTATYN